MNGPTTMPTDLDTLDTLDTPDRRRPSHRWRAAGPAVIALLLIGRTTAAIGLDAAIGFSIAAVLLAIAAVAHRPDRWVAALLLVGPVALVASPARTELSFNLARPDDTGWFVFTVATAIGAGLCIAAALDVALDVRARRAWRPIAATLVVVSTAALAAVGFATTVSAIDPQPDLGADLTDAERAALVDIGLVNYAYALPSDRIDAYLVTTDGDTRFRARLQNPSDLPHTFSVERLGVDVYVPAGREAIVDVAFAPADVVEIVCLIDGHADLGMTATLR